MSCVLVCECVCVQPQHTRLVYIVRRVRETIYTSDSVCAFHVCGRLAGGLQVVDARGEGSRGPKEIPPRKAIAFSEETS